MDKFFEKLGKVIVMIIVSSAFGLLLAFPTKWCWNYTMPFIFDLPIITWGHAWCLHWIAGIIINLNHNND